MSLMERVSEIGADQALVDDGSVRTARQALTREIARSARPARAQRRRVWASVGIGGLVAGAAATAIVVGSVVAPVQPPSAAAAVFDTAADAVLEASDRVLADGQYLRVETTRDYLVTDARVRGAAVTANAFRYVETDVLYVPADREDDWFYDFSTPTEVTERWGADAEELERSVMAGYDYRDTGVVRLPAGIRGEGADAYPVVPHLQDFADMPREPEQLIAWFREHDDVPAGYEGKAILESLALGLAPADLRAALFRALALLPDFEVAAQDGSEFTITRTGEEYSQQFMVDTATGMITSVIDASEEAPGSVVPADQPGMVQAFSTTVVDAPPTNAPQG